MNAQKVLSDLKRRFPNEPEYHQAVAEVLGTIEAAYNEHPEFDRYNLIERLCIPAHIFSFRVTWLPHTTQQRYRPVQRRYPFSLFGKPFDSEIPCFRANIQKLIDHTPHGWR